MPPANFPALRHFAQISHSSSHSRSLTSVPAPHPSDYDTHLTQSATDLRRRLMDSEMALAELSSQLTIPDDDLVPESPYKRLRRLKAETAAHDRSFQTIDYLPPPDSPLNTLIACRNVQRTISQMREAIPSVQRRLEGVRAELKVEEAMLEEQNRLASALQSRLAEMEEMEQRIEGGGGGVGLSDAVKEMSKRRRELSKRSAKLLKELLLFLKDGGLARMIAAEDMGGPVVGEELDVTLETGFDKRGRTRRGERRIDEMWGQAEVGPEMNMVHEFKDLLEEVMNASLETTPYVELKKDSAVARFLVRAKVAAFHPKDARKLKLLDFGSTVEGG